MQNKSAIRQMLYGKRGNKNLIKITDEYKRLINDAINNEKELIEKLKDIPQLLELYEKAEYSSGLLQDESICTHYAEGFKFGFLMGIEVAQNDDNE